MSGLPFTTRVKPRVAVVYSTAVRSSESRYLGRYLGARLALGGYAEVSLVPFAAAAAPVEGLADMSVRRLKSLIAECGGSSSGCVEKTHLVARAEAVVARAPPAAAPSAAERGPLLTLPHHAPWWRFGAAPAESPDNADCRQACPFAEISECHVVLVCVDAPDTEAAGAAVLAQLAAGCGKGVSTPGVFSLQYGVKNHTALATLFGEGGPLLVDGAVGFRVGRRAGDGALGCLTGGCSLALQRLSKDNEAHGGGEYYSLLESTGIPLLYRRGLTPHTWGALCGAAPLEAVAAVANLPLAEALRSRPLRLVAAGALRESLAALDAASGDGKWAPDGRLALRGLGSLRFLELWLCLPTLLVRLTRFLVLPGAPGLESPLQSDVRERRPGVVEHHLGELLAVAVRQKGGSASLDACVAHLRAHARRSPDDAAPPRTAPAALYEAAGRPTASTRALVHSTSRYGGLFGVLVVLWLLGDVIVPWSGPAV